VQGYLISHPIELHALFAFLADTAHIAAVTNRRLSFDRNQRAWQRG